MHAYIHICGRPAIIIVSTDGARPLLRRTNSNFPEYIISDIQIQTSSSFYTMYRQGEIRDLERERECDRC